MLLVNMVFAVLVLLAILQSCCAQFRLTPKSVVQAEGLEAVFECLSEASEFHGWTINGVLRVGNTIPPDLTYMQPNQGLPARLIFPATPKYNNTVVQCVAISIVANNNLLYEYSANTTLKVQGPLHAVTNFKFLFELSSNTTNAISWDPPFSLNLTTAEPDIQYCVDVFNVTGGGNDHLQSVCNITDTYYTFNASDSDQLFNFTVTPRSNVEGSLNGTTSALAQTLEPTPMTTVTEPPSDSISSTTIIVLSILGVTVVGAVLILVVLLALILHQKSRGKCITLNSQEPPISPVSTIVMSKVMEAETKTNLQH